MSTSNSDTNTNTNVIVQLEVCIDSIASGIAAELGGAHRIELCSALSEGGLTPTVGFLRKIKEKLKIPIFVMIRPRCGDFLYSQDEVDIMKEDIRVLKENGADGFVFGALTKSASVCVDTCQQLLKETRPLPVTFHRAFDQAASPLLALETILELGFTRILTSGQEAHAQVGISLIKELVLQSSGRIGILAGTGVSPSNVAEIVSGTGVKEVHASARKLCRSPMELPESTFGKKVTMGSQDSDDTVTYVTDKDIVTKIVANAQCQ